MTAVRGWNKRTDAWLSKLRTWQFVLLWDGAIVGCALLSLIFFQWLWTSHVNLSVLLGYAIGILLASNVFAFIARSQIQDRAKRNAGKPSTGSHGPVPGRVRDMTSAVDVEITDAQALAAAPDLESRVNSRPVPGRLDPPAGLGGAEERVEQQTFYAADLGSVNEDDQTP